MSIRILFFSLSFFVLSCTSPIYKPGVDLYPEDNVPILKDALSEAAFQANEDELVSEPSLHIKEDAQAFAAAQPFLEKEYGNNENILSREYAFYRINGYWIVKGLLPSGFTGSTLIAVVDARSGETIYTEIWR